MCAPQCARLSFVVVLLLLYAYIMHNAHSCQVSRFEFANHGSSSHSNLHAVGCAAALSAFC